MAEVLIVDDEPSVCWALEKYLESRGHQARVAASAEDGLAQAAERRPDLILLDVQLPGIDGLSALERLQAEHADPPPVVIITAHGTMSTAVEAMRKGAFDYLTKPLDLSAADEVLARALRSLEKAEGITAPADPLAVQLIGSSPQMQAVYKTIGTIAASDATVLITGESGTGKELVARMIHQSSARRHQPFEPLVCASLPETLLESELYGHEAGAFTGAATRRIGRLERAHTGTLLLDEVSEIPPAAQVKLLRFLQEREIERVGGGERIPLDVRLIAASNRPLRELVAAERFREDLYYRLQVVEIELPPLRRRAEDIPALIGAFLAAAGHEAGISTDALALLQKHYWPGNVRELRHAIDRAVAVARGALIAPDHLPPYLLSGAPRQDAAELAHLLQAQLEASKDEHDGDLYAHLLGRWEAALLPAVMAATDGNQLRAAALLGMSRGTLRKKLRAHGLKTSEVDE